MIRSIYLIRTLKFNEIDSFLAFESLLSAKAFMRKSMRLIDSNKSNWKDITDENESSTCLFVNKTLKACVEIVEIGFIDNGREQDSQFS